MRRQRRSEGYGVKDVASGATTTGQQGMQTRRGGEGHKHDDGREGSARHTLTVSCEWSWDAEGVVDNEDIKEKRWTIYCK